MQLGLIGLGRMGGNMARRLVDGGHTIVAWDRSADAVHKIAAGAISGAASIDALVTSLAAPRAVWIMVPAGEPTEQTVNALADRLSPGDVIVDGGNSHFKDDVRRAAALKARGVFYLDAGTSGGVWGAERGYCLMIGGEREPVDRLTPIFRTLAPGNSGLAPMASTLGSSGSRAASTTAADGFLHCGPAGAGHFVKMVHNGIEYGLMQSYAEGFDVLRNATSQNLPADQRYDLDLGAIAELWRRGSVVSSWLLDLTARALAADPQLSAFEGHVPDSGEGRWTVAAAIEEDVPADVLTTALFTRFRSRRDHTFAEKILSALRAQFGGHVEHPR
ncbi:MAG TPA: decarboxylating 6-phosphogluconate dehydrogenase [Vicinamibacterales bacterium]|nr:decarboxylating 6-phosphogluconate dehydrogenase [Vicinamibacterales bacterium]